MAVSLQLHSRIAYCDQRQCWCYWIANKHDKQRNKVLVKRRCLQLNESSTVPCATLSWVVWQVAIYSIHHDNLIFVSDWGVLMTESHREKICCMFWELFVKELNGLIEQLVNDLQRAASHFTEEHPNEVQWTETSLMDDERHIRSDHTNTHTLNVSPAGSSLAIEHTLQYKIVSEKKAAWKQPDLLLHTESIHMLENTPG